VHGSNFWLSYALLCAAGVGPIVALAPFFAIPADILPKNVAGGAVALINSMGALGGFLGSYFVGWLNGLTHNPLSSFLLMGVSLAIAGRSARRSTSTKVGTPVTSRRSHVPAFIAIAAALALSARPQTSAQTAVHGATTTMSVFVNVSNRSHVPIEDLESADFLIKEDGKDRTVLSAVPAAPPLQIIALVDDNGTGIFRYGLARFAESMQGRAKWRSAWSPTRCRPSCPTRPT
jgi:MFS family permease